MNELLYRVIPNYYNLSTKVYAIQLAEYPAYIYVEL